jgi:hypothetical protein
VVLLDRFSFDGREDEESRAELSAIRHALAEYDVAHHLVHAGDDLSSVLGRRAIGARAPAIRERTRA